MKNRSFTPVGSMHPVLFFVGVYAVALFFSIFICSSLFYSCNSSSASPLTEKTGQPVEKQAIIATAVAMNQ
ncbi:MAG: hypothetical protein HOP10_09710 [Chitinophagaceae bacterium]|nr:hypothetical protein [Chitinophagaceae bacterium]